MGGGNDPKGSPQHKRQRLNVRGHVQPGYLQDQTHHKDQAHRGYVEVSQRLQWRGWLIKESLAHLYSSPTHVLTPKGVIDPADVDGDERERNAQQVEGQEAVVVLLRATRERVVDRGHDHAHLEAHDENGRHHLVLRRPVVAQVRVVRPAEGEEQQPAEDVAPDVDRLVGPPEYALDAEPCGQYVPVAPRDERVELQVLGRLLVL